MDTKAAASRVAPSPPGTGKRVALFVTCLVDMFRPSVGFAAAKLLEEAGCTVEVPLQSCCGQPAYNSGDREDARAIAAQVIDAFSAYDYVVAPSGSCAGMIAHHYPGLFEEEPDLRARAFALAEKTFELTAFLHDVLGIRGLDRALQSDVTYHDSCSGLRELGVKEQPRALLQSLGVKIHEMPNAETCCGFGGTFCVKYPDISNAMVSDKSKEIAASGAGTVLAGDLGCLMNMAGKLSRDGYNVKARHVAEVLAGMADKPAIGEAEE
ncbi:MAG: (Fe-S)-binding protein [Reyranellaceae bacterium]